MARVSWNGDRLAKAAKQAAIEICQMTAEDVKGNAVDLAPLDKGPLRGSATVNKIENGAEVSFNTPYAKIMHESQNYTPSHAGTGPNYLRQPLLEAQDKFLQDVADAVDSILR
jgi:hypothetical protein